MATSIKISQLPQLTEPATGSLAVMVDSGITHFITANDLFNNGLDISSNTIHATNNGNGTNFKVGDDAWIGDINDSNTIQIKGVENSERGFLRFGGTYGKIGYSVKGYHIGITGVSDSTFGGATFGSEEKGSIQYGWDNLFLSNNNVSYSFGEDGAFTLPDNNTIKSMDDLVTIDSSLKISGSLHIHSSSLFPQNTGSSLVSYDQISGQLYHTTYASALPALFAAGGFYSTQTQSGSANVSSSFTFNESLGINSVSIQSGSHIVCDKAATYNLQFSIQVVQGPSAANLAVWLKKNGSNVANTATYISVPSNTKQVMALNIWDSTTTPGDYYQLAYQSDSANTTYAAIAATGNIPLSPSIILTVNQIR